MFGHDMLLAGSADVVVAGGMESMTNAPYLLQKARSGYRIVLSGALALGLALFAGPVPRRSV